MTRFLFLILTAGTLLAQTDSTLDDLLKKHCEARGGLEKMQAIRTLKVTGKAVMMGGQMEAPMTMLIKRPSAVRVEMTIQGKAMVQAFDGASAWSINPFRGGEPRASGEQESRRIQESADFDGPLVNPKEKGIDLALEGKEDLDGAPAYKVKVTRKSGEMEYHFVDAKTFLVRKMWAKRTMMGREMEIDSFPSNYKAVKGVMIPHSMEQKVSGNTMMQMTYDTVEADAPIDDAVFRMPALEPKKEEKKP